MPADRGSNTTTTLAYGASASEREKSLDLTVTQIERRFGKGAIMKLGEHRAHVKVEAIPTGSIALDLALGVGGIPRGRITEIYGPESSGKTTLAQHIIANAQRPGAICAIVHPQPAPHPTSPDRTGVNL